MQFAFCPGSRRIAVYETRANQTKSMPAYLYDMYCIFVALSQLADWVVSLDALVIKRSRCIVISDGPEVLPKISHQAFSILRNIRLFYQLQPNCTSKYSVMLHYETQFHSSVWTCTESASAQKTKVRCRCNVVNFLQTLRKWHPGMGCFLGVQILIYMLPLSPQ